MRQSAYFILIALLFFFFNESHASERTKKINTAILDTVITSRVETAVLKAKILDDESIPLVGIIASTKNGVVTLAGNVRSPQSLAFVIKRVNEISGVQKIISKIEVRKM